MESSSSSVKEEGSPPHSPQERCSVCIEPVIVDAKERSIAKLKCGHLFHLDCIGSSYNSKGRMQCPNCRDIEDGNWYYATGNTERTFDDYLYEEELMIDMNPNLVIYESHHHFNPHGWCPFDHSYPQMSLPVGELEIATDPGTLVDHVCENASSTCPFLHVNDSRSSRHPIGYDSMAGSFQHMQNDFVGDEFARHEIPRYMQIESLGADAATRLHSIPLVDAGLRRAMSHQEMPVPYRVPNDLELTHRHMNVTSPSTVWTESNSRGPVQRSSGPLPSSVSNLNGVGTSSRWRYRDIGGAGRTGQRNESHGQFRGIQPYSASRIASVSGTTWQGDQGIDTRWQRDQGIPWRRDAYSDYSRAALEPEFSRWNSSDSSDSNTDSYHGANGL